MLTRSGLAMTLIALPITAALAASAEAPVGAMSCAGCHAASASVKTPVPRLVGRKADDITAAMQGFRSGERPATIMDRLAKGFSDDETKAIAEWYAGQKD